MEVMVTDFKIPHEPFRQKEKVEDTVHRLKKEPVQMEGEVKAQTSLWSRTQEVSKVGRG